MPLFPIIAAKEASPIVFSSNSNLEARRALLARARKGDGQAQVDLMASMGCVCLGGRSEGARRLPHSHHSSKRSLKSRFTGRSALRPEDE